MFNELFYTIFQDNRKQIVFGERPTEFANVGNITMRALEQHQTYLKRLENFPLAKAEYYKNLKEATGAKSVRALSEITGEDWSYIAKVLRTLDLPKPIQEFLRTHADPTIIKHFNLRKLLELIQIENGKDKLFRFLKMVEEANNLSNYSEKPLQMAENKSGRE